MQIGYWLHLSVPLRPIHLSPHPNTMTIMIFIFLIKEEKAKVFYCSFAFTLRLAQVSSIYDLLIKIKRTQQYRINWQLVTSSTRSSWPNRYTNGKVVWSGVCQTGLLIGFWWIGRLSFDFHATFSFEAIIWFISNWTIFEIGFWKFNHG